MSTFDNYNTHLNILHEALELIDVGELADECPHFYVVSGQFIIDLEDRSVTLDPRQGFVVPKGVRHRPRAPERTVILMVETATIVPTGD